MTSRKGHSFATRQLGTFLICRQLGTVPKCRHIGTVLAGPAGEPTNGKDCPRWLLLHFEGFGQADALDGAHV